VNLHTYAGGGGSCMGSSGGIAACYAGIKDRDTDEFFSVFPGAYAHESGSWGDSDYETDNEVSIINVYNHGTYYDIYDDDVYYGTLNGINSSHEYGYYVKCYNHGYSACSNGYGRGESKGRIDWINISGMKGAGDIDTFGNCSTTWNMLLNSTTTNLTRAYVDLDFVQPANTAYTIELSPDGGSNWESTTDKTVHYFINQGNVLMLRINLTSADTSTSVRIDDLIVQVVPGFASGIGIDVGYDGSIEWNRTAKLNSSNGPINITFEQIGVAQYIGDNCPNANTCLVPIAFKVDTSGNIGVSNMNFTEVFDILYLDKSVIQANVSDASKNIMLHFTSSQNGSINLTSLDIEYSGNDDVNISSNFYGNENYSAASDWQLMSWRYSPFTATWPTGISSYEVYPLSVDSKQVSPWGQLIKSTEASSVAMWNITTTALTDPIKVYRWIPTMDACLTLFVCDYSNLTSCTTITSDNSTTIITNLNNTESQKIYDFWNLTACNPVNLYLPGDHKFRGICQDCVEVW